MHDHIFDPLVLGKGSSSNRGWPGSPCEQAAVPGSPRAAPPTADAAAKRVLLVDDNQDALDVLRMILEQVGHVVVTAEDGPSALEALKTFCADVAVVDIGLPVMDGYEVAREMRRARGDRVPGLIALTGYGGDSDRSRTKQAGFAVHLTKPVDTSHLLAAIQHTRRFTAAPAGHCPDRASARSIDPETEAEF